MNQANSEFPSPDDEQIDEKPTEQPKPKLRAPDGGWGWVVVCGTILGMMVLPTTFSGYGVMVPFINKELNGTIATASWVPALGGAIFNLIGPYASALLIIYSHRRLAVIGTFIAFLAVFLSALVPSMMFLYLTYGVLLGIGVGLSSSMGLLMTQEYFVAKRPLATGIVWAGASVGQMAVPLLIQYLLNGYGMRGGLLLFSAVLLNGIVGAMVYQPARWHYVLAETDETNAPQEKSVDYQPVWKNDPENVEENSKRDVQPALLSATHGSMVSMMGVNVLQNKTLRELRQQMKTHHLQPQRRRWLRWIPRCPHPRTIINVPLLQDGFFWIFSITLAISRLTYQEFNVLVPSFGQSMDIDPTWSASLVTVLATADTVARLIMPVVSDQVSRFVTRNQFYMSSFILCAVGAFVTAFSSNFACLATGCIIYGLGVGGNMSLAVVILVERYGLDLLASAYGMNIFFSGIFIFPGVIMIGKIAQER